MKKIDSIEWLERDRKLVNNKKFLNWIYKDFYSKIKSTKLPKPVVEIGSGAGFIKKIIPGAMTTDVIKASGIDIKAFAEKLPFKKSSIGSIVMLNVFHHIKDPKSALKEFERCLKPGGKIVMIEPWVTSFSKFIYQNFHHETFDPEAGWKINGKGRMSDANGALPWIIFSRDVNLFKHEYPNLKIEQIKPHTPLRYLLSGGLSKPQLILNYYYRFLGKFEKLISPLNKHLAMFATITITKVKVN